MPRLPPTTPRLDGKLLKAELRRLGREFNAPILDTLSLSRKLLPELKSFKLKSVCKALSVSLKNAHRAVHDANCDGVLSGEDVQNRQGRARVHQTQRSEHPQGRAPSAKATMSSCW